MAWRYDLGLAREAEASTIILGNENVGSMSSCRSSLPGSKSVGWLNSAVIP